MPCASSRREPEARATRPPTAPIRRPINQMTAGAAVSAVSLIENAAPKTAPVATAASVPAECGDTEREPRECERGRICNHLKREQVERWGRRLVARRREDPRLDPPNLRPTSQPPKVPVSVTARSPARTAATRRLLLTKSRVGERDRKKPGNWRREDVRAEVPDRVGARRVRQAYTASS